MKKRVGYLLLIIISVVGSRVIFGKDYHLNSDSLKEENLYVYKNLDNGNILSTYVDGEDFYYVVKDNSGNQYRIVKYNLTKAKKDEEYILNSKDTVKNVTLFEQKGYLYLISNYQDYYKLDKKLKVISKNSFSIEGINAYGIYNDKVVYSIKNEIYYDNQLLASVPASCGESKEIIYDRNTYFHFYNENTGFGCLYNIDDKKIEYLDYENAYYVKNRLLEYQDNRLSFKYDGITYYFNDITESNNLKMHNRGDYLFTIDTTNNKLRVYNIESRKIIFEKTLLDLKGAIVSNIMIDNYVLFLLNKDNHTSLYVWDYLKETRRSSDMIDYNEKEYKFKNNEMKEEIKNNYNIDVCIYDQAVDYFDNYYVLASYDDILINSRLITLKEVLAEFNQEETKFISNIKILFDKDIVVNKEDNKPVLISSTKSDSLVIAINITNDSFKENIETELLRIYPNLEKNIELTY